MLSVRFAAVLTGIVLLPIVLWAMTRWPWQLDAVIAGMAIMLFAYYFERT